MGKTVSGKWWRLFHSPTLDDLLNQAVAGNLSLAAAEGNLAQAEEAVAVATGGLYPQVNVNAGAERQKLNFAALTGSHVFPNTIFSLFSFGAMVNYPLDIWGGLKRGIERQEALAQFQAYQLDGAYLTVTGNAVAQAIQIATVDAQIKAVEEIIGDDQNNLDLVRQEMRIGTVSELDVEQAASQLAADRTLLAPLRQQASVARHALAILVGKSPADWRPPDFTLDDFTLPQEIPVSLPSELVRERPDLLAAEAQLHAASAAVGVATAQLYPNISISAAYTQEALVPYQILRSSSSAWSLGGNVTDPLLHGGQLIAQRRAALAAYRTSFATYKQTVQQSFGQIADLLQALSHDAQLLADERQAMEASENSLKLLRTAYKAGSVGVLQILDQERLYNQALLGYVRAKAQRYADTVQLFVAMGGGWTAPDSPAATLSSGEAAPQPVWQRIIEP